MYVASILTLPLVVTGPVDPARPDQAVTSDAPLLGRDAGDVEIGVWECTPGSFDGTTGDFDESMLMVSGRVTIEHEAGEYDIAPGTLWTTPRQWPCRWTVHDTVRKLYVIDHRPGGQTSPAHESNAHRAALGEFTRRPVVAAGDPHEASRSILDANGLDVGIWESTTGAFPFRRDGYDEVFCVLCGHATLAVDVGEGAAMTFDLRPGSVVLTSAGTTGTWDVHEPLRKAYTIVRR
jgi:uncharacterized cupin superfamily protein